MASKNATDFVARNEVENERRLLLDQLLDQQRKIQECLGTLSLGTLSLIESELDKIKRAVACCEESRREDGVNTLRSCIDRIQAILEKED
jgi:hypothetical protein